METTSNPTYRCHHCTFRREQQKVTSIIDDPVSSRPHSLLHWLKRQLHTFTPVNNPDYNPLLPAA